MSLHVHCTTVYELRSRRSPTTDRKKNQAGSKLLSGGNPQIPKGKGNGPVAAYITAMPEWKRDIGERLDALVVDVVPDVHKAVKWNQPFHGFEGDGRLPSTTRCATSTSTRTRTGFAGGSSRPVDLGREHVNPRWSQARLTHEVAHISALVSVD
jgi:hypothetical protein